MTILATYPRGTCGAAPAPAPGAPTFRADAPTVPLVLLHAFPTDHRLWEPVAALLPDLPVFLVDLPGFGNSPHLAPLKEAPPTPQPPTLDAAAPALWQTLDQLGFDRIVLAGLSLGGYLSMAALRAAPARVAALALLDTKASRDDEPARQRRLDMAAEVTATNSIDPIRPMAQALLGPHTKSTRPDIVAQVQAWVEDCTPAAIAWAQTAMATRPDSTPTLRNFTGPAAVIVGQDDAQTPPPVAQDLAANLTNASFTIVPQAGHLTAVENPEPVANALRDLHHRATAE